MSGPTEAWMPEGWAEWSRERRLLWRRSFQLRRLRELEAPAELIVHMEDEVRRAQAAVDAIEASNEE